MKNIPLGGQRISHGQSAKHVKASNISISSDLSKTLINFNNREESKLYLRTRDGHCGESVCTTDGSEMLSAINDLYENGVKIIETPTPTPNPVPEDAQVTAETTIPVLPTNGTYVTMEWDLSVIDPAYSGISFRVEITAFDSFSYRLRNPKLVSATSKQVGVVGIRPRLNGNYDESNGHWIGVSQTVNAQVGVILSTTAIIMAKDLSSGDKLSISFDELSLP